MHPIIAEQVAADRAAQRHADAEVRRRVGRARGDRAPAAWRGRPARWLVALARRLDPAAVPGAPVGSRGALRRA